MIKTIYFITSNKYKFQIASKAFENSGIKLIQKEIDVPEIQTNSLEEVASFSANWIANKFNQPFFLTDAGCFVEALNGFPGPFMKYTNKYLSADDLLKLMSGKKNRKIIFKDCLVYCKPKKKPVTFLSSSKGTISKTRGKSGQTPIDELFIPEGFDRPASEISKERMVSFWNDNNTNYKQMVDFLKKENKAKRNYVKPLT